ncbi:MAG: hypothetical protein K1Y02_15495 [Candidatus Hydrogenedentes bacterium]|nr:hypothetical protein [Candidatus Hydrogenedentota bacterium]
MLSRSCISTFVIVIAFTFPVFADPLPNTSPLEVSGDFAALMVSGIDAYLSRESVESPRGRNFSSGPFSTFDLPANWDHKSLDPFRQPLARLVGANEARDTGPFELVTPLGQSTPAATCDAYDVYAVRWRVLRDVYGEGLLLEPKTTPIACVVALPDCDWTPETIAGMVSNTPADRQFACRLAQAGCRVVIPTLIDRNDTHSGNPDVRMTNQPHREYIYRAAFEMGHHIIGYDVQKVLSVVDRFTADNAGLPIGIVGYGEGGLVAQYSAALDGRIKASIISGYFKPREELYREPIYRNVWGILRQFGDAELVALAGPNVTVIEASEHPHVTGPPPARDGRRGAAPGVIETPSFEAVSAEVERAQKARVTLGFAANIKLVRPEEGKIICDESLAIFMETLGPSVKVPSKVMLPQSISPPVDPDARMKRQVQQLVDDVQVLVRASDRKRAEFWSNANPASIASWQTTTKWYRDYFRKEVIGSLPDTTSEPNPRTRLIYDEPAYRGYEVMLDVCPDIFAYGILLVPKDIKDGERRPVVVCQHGLEGNPKELAEPKSDNDYYHGVAWKLAEQGFVTFSPQNPYTGGESFRVLQRKANPLKLSLFSFITAQHARVLEWLGTQPFVDPSRIAFYGLSYGGKTALRVPAQLDGYCLSICSGDYNEWIWKMTSVTAPFSYMFTHEYEMYEFDLGNTFNHAEMTWLICPRPFMVERGHSDGVGIDEWVAYEYARTRRHYDALGLGDRTTIEFFNGPHTMHMVGTFDFLRTQLNWPPR